MTDKDKLNKILEKYIEKISLLTDYSREEILKKARQKKQEHKGITDIGALYMIKNELDISGIFDYVDFLSKEDFDTFLKENSPDFITAFIKQINMDYGNAIDDFSHSKTDKLEEIKNFLVKNIIKVISLDELDKVCERKSKKYVKFLSVLSDISIVIDLIEILRSKSSIASNRVEQIVELWIKYGITDIKYLTKLLGKLVIYSSDVQLFNTSRGIDSEYIYYIWQIFNRLDVLLKCILLGYYADNENTLLDQINIFLELVLALNQKVSDSIEFVEENTDNFYEGIETEYERLSYKKGLFYEVIQYRYGLRIRNQKLELPNTDKINHSDVRFVLNRKIILKDRAIEQNWFKKFLKDYYGRDYYSELVIDITEELLKETKISKKKKQLDLNDLVNFRGALIPRFESNVLEEIEQYSTRKFSYINEFKVDKKMILSIMIWVEDDKMKKMNPEEKNEWLKSRAEIELNNSHMAFTTEHNRISKLSIDNKVTVKIPDSIGQITALRQLYILSRADVPRKSLPSSIGQLNLLEVLVIRGVGLESIPESIGNLTELYHLNLRWNNLKKLPESIGNLGKLKFFHLGGNKLLGLPGSFVNLKSLVTLDLSRSFDNNVENLPSLKGLDSLQYLNLENNKFTKVSGLEDLKALKLINLTKNEINEIKGLNKLKFKMKQFINEKVNEFDRNTLLRLESLTGVEFRVVRDIEAPGFAYRIFNNRIVGICYRPTTLELCYGRTWPKNQSEFSPEALKELPEIIAEFSALEELYISHNPIEEIPDFIGKLKNLKFLGMSYNKIRSISDSIENLGKLERLDLSGNNISNLPSAIGKLMSLKYLNLSWNVLTSIPESIGLLESLKELNLSGNNLREIPKSIGDIESLQKLRLSDNNLKILPETIGNLRSLIVLGLSNNELTTLPPTIGDLPLTYPLNLRFNDNITLPKSIIKLGAVILEREKLSGTEAYDRSLNDKSSELVVEYKINKYMYISRKYEFEKGVHVYVKGYVQDINMHTFSDKDDDDTFYKVCDELKAWVAHNYDIRLTDFALALRILERLIELGAPSAYDIFQNEIKRALDGEVPEQALYLIYQIIPSKFKYQTSKIKYYELLDPKDIVNLIDNSQSRVIRNIITSMRTEYVIGELTWNVFYNFNNGENPFLKDFIFTGKGNSAKVYQITKILEENNAEDFKHLLSLGFMEIFSDQDLHNLIKNPKILLKQNLLRLIGSGIHPETRSSFFRSLLKTTNSLICRIKNLTSEWYQDLIDLLLTELPKYPSLSSLGNYYPLDNYKSYLLYGLIPIGNITIYRDLATSDELDTLDKAIRLEYNYEGKSYYVIKGIRPYETKDLHSYSLEGVSPVVPSNLEILKDLEYLSLTGCGISTIKDLPEFKNLKYLHLQSNELQDLDGIEKYPNLLELNVRRNKIANIQAIQYLTKLNTLDLSDNLLEDFKLNPQNLESLKKLKKLSGLNLANNKSLNYEELREKLNINFISETPRRDREQLRFSSYSYDP